MPKEIIYPTIEKKEVDRAIEIKAGKSWTDKDRIKRYEGIRFKIPKEISNNKENILAVMSLKKGKESDSYILHLHGHSGYFDLKEPYPIKRMEEEYAIIDAGGDIGISLLITRDLLKKWIELDGREIDSALNNFSVGSAYNLLSSIPRKFIVRQEEVIIQFGKGEKIDSLNVCRKIFTNKYPLDL